MPSFDPSWVIQHSRISRRQLWRAVEAQHRVATMSLVDTLDEQHLLEQMLEGSKPPPPLKADYLLTTPFRYTSTYPSRFRRAHESGVWYGAEDIPTACAEAGYWRWRFLMDSDGLKDKEVRAELTVFQARVQGSCIDLTMPPWSALQHLLGDPLNYAECHKLAETARTSGISWLRYRSTRWPKGICAAALSPTALSRPRPERIQTWRCRISATALHFVHEETWLSFKPDGSGLLNNDFVTTGSSYN
jgi:hypothetical protein